MDFEVGPDGMPKEDQKFDQKQMEQKQKERKDQLAHSLLIKLEPYPFTVILFSSHFSFLFSCFMYYLT